MSAPRQPARVRLLKAAGELFYEHGITATGVDAVIERAGVATGSLYKNFSGKDDLVTAYLADRDQRWRDVWESAIAAAQDPVERVLAIFVATDRWYRETGVVRGCAHVAAANQLPPHHPGLAVAADHKRHVIERLTTLIAATDAVDPAGTAQDIALLYDGMLSAMAIPISADPVARAIRLARVVLTDGPGGEPAPARRGHRGRAARRLGPP
ncbi:MAG: TetR/AcrR family transcriptional regulator [Mycobacterium sp.]